jgi:hypothetical protein
MVSLWQAVWDQGPIERTPPILDTESYRFCKPLPSVEPCLPVPRPVISCRRSGKAGGSLKKILRNHGITHKRTCYLTGKEEKSPRKGFIYFSDDGDLVALRFDNWKIVFMEQRCPGTLQVWVEPFVPLRLSKMFNLRIDPYERADITSNTLLRVAAGMRLPSPSRWRR